MLKYKKTLNYNALSQKAHKRNLNSVHYFVLSWEKPWITIFLVKIFSLIFFRGSYFWRNRFKKLLLYCNKNKNYKGINYIRNIAGVMQIRNLGAYTSNLAKKFLPLFWLYLNSHKVEKDWFLACIVYMKVNQHFILHQIMYKSFTLENFEFWVTVAVRICPIPR